MHMKDMRTDAEKEKDENEPVGPDGHPTTRLYVSRAQTKQERQAGKKAGKISLFVKGLHHDMDEAGLKELFKPFGAIEVTVPTTDSGKSKGYAFVTMGEVNQATKAVTELHLKVIRGQTLYVGLAESKEQRRSHEAGKGKYSGSYSGGGGKGWSPAQKGFDGGWGWKGPGKGPNGPGGCIGKGPPGPGPQMPFMGMGGQQVGGMMPNGMSGMMNGKGMMGKGPPIGPQNLNTNMGSIPPVMMPMLGGKGGPGSPCGSPCGGACGGNQMMRPPSMCPGPMPMPMPMPMPGQQNSPGPGVTAEQFAMAPPAMQKQMLGERLFAKIQVLDPAQAGKITGMMLEMDNSDILRLLNSEQELFHKVKEALDVLAGNSLGGKGGKR